MEEIAIWLIPDMKCPLVQPPAILAPMIMKNPETKLQNLYKLALDESDYATQIELQWFISEQIEEEKKNKDIIQQLKLSGNKHTALFMIDQKLAAMKQTADSVE